MVVQGPFSELTKLELKLLSSDDNDDRVPVIPDSSLSGSAPRLRSLYFEGIPFPGLPKLLLSSVDLVELELILCFIPPSPVLFTRSDGH